MKTLKFIIAFLFISLITFQMVHVYIANNVSQESLASAAIRREIAALDEENTRLKFEILNDSRLEMIASRAAILGFEYKRDTLSLTEPLPLAVKNDE